MNPQAAYMAIERGETTTGADYTHTAIRQRGADDKEEPGLPFRRPGSSRYASLRNGGARTVDHARPMTED